VILHAGVLALLLGTGSVLALLLAASGGAVGVLRHWDFSSSSERQLRLERRTYLISTILNYAVGFQAASAFLFVYTVDDLHSLLVGAMCATGSLNANPIGWWALGVKLALLLAGGAWIALNVVDQRAEDYPLVRLKYALLLYYTPLVAVDFALQLRYFLGIHPDVITSCCGSLFTQGSQGLASTLSALPVRPAMWGFYGSAAVLFAAGAWCLRRPSTLSRCAFSGASAWFLAAAGAAVVSFLSLYIYRMPTHHCPFDFLQGEYYFLGYPVYGSLLLGTLFGILPALFVPLRRVGSLGPEIDRLERKWVHLGLFWNALFVALVSYPVAFGSFRLLPYA